MEGLKDSSPSDKRPLLLQPHDVGMPKLGIGMDASVTPLKYDSLCLVQTTDFFYPIVDDPYMQGAYAYV